MLLVSTVNKKFKTKVLVSFLISSQQWKIKWMFIDSHIVCVIFID
jgi:hypothetical protein